jgi:hypothetical protein
MVILSQWLKPSSFAAFAARLKSFPDTKHTASKENLIFRRFGSAGFSEYEVTFHAQLVMTSKENCL